MYICMYVCIYMHEHMCINIYMYVLLYLSSYVNIHVCTYMYIICFGAASNLKESRIFKKLKTFFS